MRVLLAIAVVCALAVSGARAQVAEELSRKALLRDLDAISVSLNVADLADARARVLALGTALTGRPYPPDEVRRDVVAISLALQLQDRKDAAAQVDALRSRFATRPTELSRAQASAEIKTLDASFNTTATSLPPAVFASVQSLAARLEPFPSFYRAWVARRLDAVFQWGSARLFPAARAELALLLRGAGTSEALDTWRAGVTASFTVEITDPALRAQTVLTAVSALPAGEVIPPGSPFAHWTQVHLPVLTKFLTDAVAKPPAERDPFVAQAKAEWQALLDTEREF